MQLPNLDTPKFGHYQIQVLPGYRSFSLSRIRAARS
jgi:hypothetical protein